MGKPKDPDYWRKWRAAHPEYVAREKERSRKRRANGQRGDRTIEYRNRAARLRVAREAVALPTLATHPLMRCAHCLVSSIVQRDMRHRVYRDLYDDAVAEVLMAWVTGERPMDAIKRARSYASSWEAKVDTGT